MSSDAVGSGTPPRSARVQTPPAPRYGFHDSWEPYAPRKSARISSQRASNRTPSPSPPRHRRQPASPGTAKRPIGRSNVATISPALSPRKKSQPAIDPSRTISGSLTAEGTANAAAALGLDSAKAAQAAPTASISRATGMLPTPSKTPQKRPNEKTAATIQSFARNLFTSDEEAIVPAPRRRRAQMDAAATGECFTSGVVGNPIEIFTDSQDRIPEKDKSEENPFFNVAADAEPVKRKGKRRMVVIPGEGAQSVDKASRREDGMIYVFRGKKFFRKFSECEEAQAEGELDTSRIGVEPELTRPLTRSSVRPRLLFPARKPDETNDDEEAVTDVEDDYMSDAAAANPQTPKKTDSTPAKTPEAPRYAPVSPPDTRRTTRSTNKLANAGTPMKASERRSPFDAWPRTKGEHKTSSTPKRPGDGLAAAAPKRTRA
ncbi:hypothetical protein DCS_07024 [Drechmeria coniospora]|uniref:Uncharacterized protein n=1 Tax=Drechmeria coniospora TaxID=98403 RepID=A0A151GDD2_DRECN|nr:hypothetical protein DCS_07024 [Drechmeria coniospora]KYK55063.1 hypothetical protein DCS_07024 [Drechmeria coniospora]